MTLEITDQQWLAIERGESVYVNAGSVGALVLLKADAFDDALAQDRDKAALASAGRRAADHWARENPF